MKKSRPARSSSGFSSGNKSSNKFSRPSKSEPERGGRRSTRAGKNRPAPHGAAFAGAAFAVDETIFGKRPLEELLRNKPGDVEALYVREQSELTKWLKDARLQSGIF